MIEATLRTIDDSIFLCVDKRCVVHKGEEAAATPKCPTCVTMAIVRGGTVDPLYYGLPFPVPVNHVVNEVDGKFWPEFTPEYWGERTLKEAIECAGQSEEQFEAARVANQRQRQDWQEQKAREAANEAYHACYHKQGLMPPVNEVKL